MNNLLLAIGLSLSVALTSALTIGAPKTQTATNEADRAYAELQEAFVTPPTPQAWRQKAPTAEERAAFNKLVSDRALEALIKANVFVEKYPSHPRVADARQNGEKMRQVAIRAGNEIPPNGVSFDEKARLLHAKVVQEGGEGLSMDHAAMERGLRELEKEFPRQPKVYDLLLVSARGMQEEPAKKILADIVASPIAEPQTRVRAAGLLKKFNIVGSPLEMQFTSVQGKPVDVSQMKGKVLLIDFWATWCAPCIKALPTVKEAYTQYHPKGFEIIAVSLDSSAPKLASFIQQEGMTWPQHFDGRGWQNKFAQEFGINSVPSMWLVDKKGIVRDVKAGPNLASKIEALLAEP